MAEIEWFDPQGGWPDWAEPKAKRLACLVHESEQSAEELMIARSVTRVLNLGPPRKN
jgi:hypothetical protein